MKDLRLARIFWIGAAAILIAAALIAVAAILRGEFGETEAQILGTMLTLLVAGGTAVSGLSLIERETARIVGLVAVGGAILCFAVLTAAIWDGFSTDTLDVWAVSAIPTLIALLLVATQRLIVRDLRLLPFFYATTAVAAIATGLTVSAIHAEDDGGDSTGDGPLQAILIFWILTALGYLLLPVVQRFTSSSEPSTEARVLGELDGIEVLATRGSVDGLALESPQPGERLVLRRRA